MPQELTTKEAAQQLDVPLGTLKHWVDNLPVPARIDSRNARKFDEQALAVLERIKQLRNIDDRGLDSIRVILTEELGPIQPAESQTTVSRPPAQGQPGLAVGQLDIDHEAADGRPAASWVPADEPRPAVVQLMAGPELNEEALASQLAMVVGQAVADAVARETELAEKYARATHEIGTLAERVRTLEAERLRLVEQLSAQPQPADGQPPLQLEALEVALKALTDSKARDDSLRLRLLGEHSRLQLELDETRTREQAERDRIALERDHLARELAHARGQLANLPGKLERPWWKLWGQPR